MTYEEAREAVVTAAQVRRELRKHGVTWEAFVEDCGEHAEYSGRVVLDWLGY